MNFGSKGNRTVQKTVLIGECQVLKTEKGGNQILKSTFWAKIPFLSFQRLYFEACLLGGLATLKITGAWSSKEY